MATKSKLEEIRIDRDIVRARAVVCLRRFRSTYDLAWVDLAEKHLLDSGTIRDMDRNWLHIDDPVSYLHADRIRVDAGD